MQQPGGTQTDIATDFLRQVFGPVTGDPVFVCSLPNDRDGTEPGERRLLSREMTDIGSHLARWDRRDRAFYFCVATLKPGSQPERAGGSPRCKANVSELALLWADIDFKDVDLQEAEILPLLRSLPCPPSIVIRSGNGLHVYWLLSEVLDAPHDEIEALLRQLADLVGGDLSVADVARLMRLPGSHNTKRGAWTPVEIVEADYERRHHLADIEDMVSICGPVVRRKELSPKGLQQHDNPFLAIAARLGFKPPIDVERRLAGMTFQGGAERNIHETQLAVSASLLTRGTPTEDVIGIVLDATRAAAGPYGERWNWRREERAVRGMCETWLRKNPAVTVTPRAQPRSSQRDDEVVREAVGGATVVQLDDTRQKKGRERKPRGSSALPIVIADGVVETVRGDGGDIVLAEGELWLYREGLWSVATPADELWLRTLIQTGCDTLGGSGDTKVANGAWKRLHEHPELYRRDILWDSGDTIATANGMINLRTREFGPHDPALFARRKIGSTYEPGRECPKFLRFLAGCFGNRTAGEREEFMGVLQDFFGAMLAIRTLSREQRKALLLLGPSRTGKTQIAIIARRLIGEPVAAPSIIDLTKEFGLQALYGARAWIRDDAVNEGDALDPGRFKTIITGEPVDVNRKGRSYVTVSFELPVLLTANSLPRARDATDAIYNRCIVLDMTSVVSEERAEELARGFGFTHATALADAIYEEEAPGILNWALDGLDRLRERGRYHLPDSIRVSVQHFKDANNPIGEWARSALRMTGHGKVSRPDLLCAYHGWQKEEQGDDARATGGKFLLKNLKTMFPAIDPDVRSMGTRFVGGLSLTDEGLALWDRHQSDPLRTGSKGSSLTKHDVNKPWKIHGEAHDDDGAANGTHF
jgi:P4 family phage/plasmid primase-like protien